MYLGSVAREVPDKIAYLVIDGTEAGQVREPVTYRELDERSNRLAQLWWSRGLRPGDVVAVCMENNARYLEVVWAAQRSGLLYTAANYRLTPDELAYMVDDSGARALVVSAATEQSALTLLDRTPSVRVRLAVGADLPGHERYEEAVATFPACPLDTELEGGDMLYSSGTTGRPKGIRSSIAEPAPIGEGGPLPALLRQLYGFGPDTVYLSPAPLYHAAPLRYCVTATRLGGTVVVMERFDPAAFLGAVSEYRATHAQVVPTMFVRLLKMPEEQRLAYDTSSLRYVIHAAAPCPRQVKQAVLDWLGPIVHEYYAGSEGNCYVACSPQDWLAHPGSVGRALLGVPHITDDDGVELGPGQIGTVWFSGGPEFSYHHDPVKTAESHDARGWSTLGDIGYLDEEGFLYLTDRRSYTIITGGVNVYPQEIEDLLVGHPDVLDAAVFGVPDPDLGQRVQAVVQPVPAVVESITGAATAGPAAAITDTAIAAAQDELVDELMRYCREHLVGPKRPRDIDIVTELPRHPTGKLYKRLLVDQYSRNNQASQYDQASQ
ncbi:fatty-acyl-CoA synthase [Parafrankia irregularis]|uniref:Fatty-acyl-CoA synthase n=1 Tax=Parafrankia irregularis TaxID=795642 RepID=A0A0S4QSK8_9ACTN|nr:MULTISPECIES: AMP-binding protein [Parafrankia]MBE3201705.1 AMP-binding protein [Parafrankia sp. CH37]CUU57450.1 fatty-acyl-CoA synthase [Parafrankia irregularis]